MIEARCWNASRILHPFLPHNLVLSARIRDEGAMTARRILSFVFTLLAALVPGPALADPSDIDAAARGVVRVVIAGREGEDLYPISHGSGFAVSSTVIVTNAHVVGDVVDDPRLVIGIVPADGGEAIYGRVISVSPRNDLALIRTTGPARLAPLTLAGIAPAGAGSVTAIGYPMNVDQAQGLGAADVFRTQPPVTSQGFLSGRRPSREFDTLLHTAPIARGNSGGPLVDDCGRVIGVNSFGTDSAGTEAEFFFAVSMRELLPFLRANSVTPLVNSLPCRSLAELEAEERTRAEQTQASAAQQAAADEAAAAEHRDSVRRDIEFAVIDARANGMGLAILLLVIAMAGGAYGFDAHRKADLQQRKIGGGVALAALALALIAWVTRPSFASVETRLEEQLRVDADAAPPVEPATAAATRAGTLTCVLDTQRSRVVGAPAESLPLEWRADGCVNARTQYGLSSGEWTRVFVPGDEQNVSINRFDPATGEYVVERYLLGREAMSAARAARAEFQAPACNAGPDAAGELGLQQDTITTLLPDRPNERLVYTCGQSVAGSLPAAE
jgi:serine protease Do